MINVIYENFQLHKISYCGDSNILKLETAGRADWSFVIHIIYPLATTYVRNANKLLDISVFILWILFCFISLYYVIWE